MLSDRPYMRGDYPQQRTSALTWLICGLSAGFILQLLVKSPWIGGGLSLENRFELSIPALKSWHLWTLLTYSFLHSTKNLFHIAGNLFALYFLGRELLPMLGTRRFFGIYAAGVALGALVWTAAHWRMDDSLIGATAAVEALFIVYACFFPNQEMTFLLLFFFPVTLKPKHFAVGLVILDLVGLIFFELPGQTLPFGISVASSAHLGGIAAGWLYYRLVHDADWTRSSDGDEIELPRWLKRVPKAATSAMPKTAVNVTSREDLRAEVDRILDKINSDGFAALTPEEKRLLDDAKDLLSRR